jgi:hypothetical protein
MHRHGVTLSEFLRRASQSGINSLPPTARALLGFRLFLGRVFRLEAEPKNALAISFGNYLAAEDRARSSVVSGTPEGLFRVVYRFETNSYLKYRTVPSMLRP